MLVHGIGLKLGQLLVGHSLCLCSIFVPAFLDRTNFGSKFCGWVGAHLLGPARLEEVILWDLEKYNHLCQEDGSVDKAKCKWEDLHLDL